MKPIKITPKNRDAITRELCRYNQTPSTFMFSVDDIFALAIKYEAQLHHLLCNKEAMVGAVVSAMSGGVVAKSFKYQREATFVRIERKSEGWFLTLTMPNRLEQTESGYERLTLTKAQDDRAVAIFRIHNSYKVQP